MEGAGQDINQTVFWRAERGGLAGAWWRDAIGASSCQPGLSPREASWTAPVLWRFWTNLVFKVPLPLVAGV